MPIKSYKELVVWQKAIVLVDEIYKVTATLPKQEMYILVSQMLRAAISIPSNIAEGYRRGHKTEFVRFLSISLGSAAELETQLVVAKLRYPDINYSKAELLTEEVQKMLYTMIQKLKLNLQSTVR